MDKFTLHKLPPKKDLEDIDILKKCILANRYLAELKGLCASIPNEAILINTLSIQEAKDSSAVENIITTHDDIFKEELFSEFINKASVKEVQHYSFALKKGFELIKKNGLLTNAIILEIQAELERNKAGFRKLPGTELRNSQNGAIVYTPPQNGSEVVDLMNNLEKYINDDNFSHLDPLIKMAVIHYQFESIHPFYDGNGRTGRIINILYLVQQKLLDIPVLYLSRFIIQNKSRYYTLLQSVRDNDNWNDWILFVLEGVMQTSLETISIVNSMHSLMMDYKHRIRDSYKFYSQDLLNNLFFHPYTKIDFIVNDLKVTRKTAAKYLGELANDGFLRKEKVGTHHYYVNEPLLKIFTQQNF